MESQEPQPVPPAVSVVMPPGDAPQERRQGVGQVIVQQGTPGWYAQLPGWGKTFTQLGFAGLVAVLFASLVLFVVNQVRDAGADRRRWEEERRQEATEQRQLFKAAIEASDKRNEALASEVRGLGSKVDALATSNQLLMATNTTMIAENRNLVTELRRSHAAIDGAVERFKAVKPEECRVPEPAPPPRPAGG